MKMTRVNSFRILLLAMCLDLSACQPGTPQPEALVQTPAFASAVPSSAIPTETSTLESPVVHGALIFSDDLGVDSPLCKPEPRLELFFGKLLR